jgi:hypothetical protein
MHFAITRPSNDARTTRIEVRRPPTATRQPIRRYRRTQGHVPSSSARRADPNHWAVLALLGVAQLMVVLDETIVNIALPSTQRQPADRAAPGRRGAARARQPRRSEARTHRRT